MSDYPPPPYRGAYWVIPGQLLAGSYPSGATEEERDKVLRALLDAGIRSVINLTEEEEIRQAEGGNHYLPYEDRLEQLAEERGLVVEIARYEFEYGSAPTEQEMELVLDALDAEIEGRNSPTLVHCSTGHGRTGVVVGCYLARHGIASGKQALEKIRELRSHDPELAKHKSPENIVQERFVTRWKEGR